MSFIVIEGLDGSGKSTQIKMLKSHFDRQRIRYEYLHFPRIDAPVYGELIARFLRGEMGNINEVDPYLIALMYAGDRQMAKTLISGWLDKGLLVLADRFVASNIAFQCAKLTDWDEIIRLRQWILNLEYQVNQLPVPDLSIFLDVPFSFTSRQLKSDRTGEDRSYLKGVADIHENDLDFQKKVRKIYLSLQGEIPGYRIMDCSAPGGEIMLPDEISGKIIHLITQI